MQRRFNEGGYWERLKTGDLEEVEVEYHPETYFGRNHLVQPALLTPCVKCRGLVVPPNFLHSRERTVDFSVTNAHHMRFPRRPE